MTTNWKGSLTEFINVIQQAKVHSALNLLNEPDVLKCIQNLLTETQTLTDADVTDALKLLTVNS